MVPNNRIRRFFFSSSKLDPPTDYPGRRNEDNLQKGDKGTDSGSPVLFWHFPVFARSRMTLPSAYQSPPSAEDIRLHTLLHERLMALRRPRWGLWSKIWRFVSGH